MPRWSIGDRIQAVVMVLIVVATSVVLVVALSRPGRPEEGPRAVLPETFNMYPAALSPDGRLPATYTQPPVYKDPVPPFDVRLWDTNNGRELTRRPVDATGRRAAIAPDNALVAATDGRRSTVYGISSASGTIRRTLESHGAGGGSPHAVLVDTVTGRCRSSDGNLRGGRLDHGASDQAPG